jgi:Fe2+ transport system protein FeoA
MEMAIAQGCDLAVIGAHPGKREPAQMPSGSAAIQLRDRYAELLVVRPRAVAQKAQRHGLP